MENSGYNEAKLDEGKILLKEVKERCNIVTDFEKNLRIASLAYKKVKQQVNLTYNRHRAITKVAMDTNKPALKILRIDKNPPKQFASWLQNVSVFYQTIAKDNGYQKKLDQFNLYKDEIEKSMATLEKLKKSYESYYKIKGLKEDSTKNRNEIMDKLSHWMNHFYIIARLELKDRPQLLESLHKTVKS
ncbi:hypothetical protein [Galbibacter sp. PAP.153]|uniref:hypothetical protein n=1 Tax=Galbibacter sp. PAP.153 TaxID=3104623 RepID=UPI00300A9690